MHKALCSALVGVSFLLAACSDSAAPNVSRPSPRSDPAAQQLAGLLITNDQLPSGLSIAPDQVGDTGPSNLAKAVHDDVGPNARAVLTQDQFVAGYQRMWRDSPSNQATQVVDFLYQFSGSGGALSYQQRIVTLLSLGSPSPQLFPVSDIANAIGLTGTLSSSRG
ncbi:MAG: hypothetical protein ACRD1G_05625, partial [Acidimicrobiales bacterium]